MKDRQEVYVAPFKRVSQGGLQDAQLSVDSSRRYPALADVVLHMGGDLPYPVLTQFAKMLDRKQRPAFGDGVRQMF